MSDQVITQAGVVPYHELVKAWGPIFVGGLTVLVTFVIQMLLMRRQERQFQRQHNLSLMQLSLAANKEERDEIQKKLNLFFGPLKELRVQSRTIYEKIDKTFGENYQASTGAPFRLIIFLLSDDELPPNLKSLLSSLLLVSRKVLSLIEQQSGLVDSPRLQEILGLYAVHIRFLSVAASGKLKGEELHFGDVVFPKEIDGAIESSILKLQDRLKELNLDGETPRTGALCQCVESTVKYYDTRAEDYARQSYTYNLSVPYAKFLLNLKRGSRLLDAGCGAGRDTRHFIGEGHVVVSFDASQGMVAKCREYPFAYCLQLDLREIAFKEEFDGIWACSSIIHLPSSEVKNVLQRFFISLKVGGRLFVCVKEGEGTNMSNGRFFQYYTEAGLKNILSESGFVEQEFWRSQMIIGDGEWLNIICLRPGKSPH